MSTPIMTPPYHRAHDLKKKGFFKRRYFNDQHFFFNNSKLSIFVKGQGPLSKKKPTKLEFSLLKDALRKVLLKLVQLFWSRSKKCIMFTDRQTDREIRTPEKRDQNSTLELSAQVSLKSSLLAQVCYQ